METKRGKKVEVIKGRFLQMECPIKPKGMAIDTVDLSKVAEVKAVVYEDEVMVSIVAKNILFYHIRLEDYKHPSARIFKDAL